MWASKNNRKVTDMHNNCVCMYVQLEVLMENVIF